MTSSRTSPAPDTPGASFLPSPVGTVGWSGFRYPRGGVDSSQCTGLFCSTTPLAPSLVCSPSRQHPRPSVSFVGVAGRGSGAFDVASAGCRSCSPNLWPARYWLFSVERRTNPRLGVGLVWAGHGSSLVRNGCAGFPSRPSYVRVGLLGHIRTPFPAYGGRL